MRETDKKELIDEVNKISNTLFNLSSDDLPSNVLKRKKPTPLKKDTKPKLTNDLLTFIKNQMLNSHANFTGYQLHISSCKVIADMLISANCCVKEVKLTKCDLNDESLVVLARGLKKNQSLTSVNLSKNNLTNKSVKVLCEILAMNKQVKVVNLQGNELKEMEKLKVFGGVKFYF